MKFINQIIYNKVINDKQYMSDTIKYYYFVKLLIFNSEFF